MSSFQPTKLDSDWIVFCYVLIVELEYEQTLNPLVTQKV